MHVPYSMRDDEPDLYGSLGGRSGDDSEWETKSEDDPYPHSTSYNIVLEYVECPKFYTQEDMDKVIQHNIKAVRAAYDEGWSEGYQEGVEEGNQNCQHR